MNETKETYERMGRVKVEKKNRVFVLDDCSMCHFFNNEYSYYQGEKDDHCSLLHLGMEGVVNEEEGVSQFPIPDSCLLSTTEEVITYEKEEIKNIIQEFVEADTQ